MKYLTNVIFRNFVFFNNNVINIEVFLIHNIIFDDSIKNEIVNFVNNRIRLVGL